MVGDGRMKRKYAENEMGLTAMEWYLCCVKCCEWKYMRYELNGCKGIYRSSGGNIWLFV